MTSLGQIPGTAIGTTFYIQERSRHRFWDSIEQVYGCRDWDGKKQRFYERFEQKEKQANDLMYKKCC